MQYAAFTNLPKNHRMLLYALHKSRCCASGSPPFPQDLPAFLPHKAFGLMHILRLRHPGFFHKGSAGKLAATSSPAEESSETVTSEEIRASLRHFSARTAAWNNYTQKKKSMQCTVSIKSQCLAWIFLVYPLCRCPCAQGCPAK